MRNSINHSFKINTIKLWSAQTISATGDAVYQLALVWIILDMTGSTAVTGVVAMSSYLPAILFGIGGMITGFIGIINKGILKYK